MSAPQVILSNLLFYLLGFVVFLAARKHLSDQSVSLFSLLISLIGVLLSMGLIVLGSGQSFTVSWFTIANHNFNFDILINNLTLLLYFIVQFVGFWVQLFSVKYMEKDSDFSRYFSYVNLFIFAMLGVVVSGNLLLLFVFWELVGFCSYLLIGFWYKRPAATAASKKAFIMNRVGDVGFLFGIFMVYSFFNTLNISEISIQATQLFADFEIFSTSQKFSKSTLLTVMGLLLFCGCIAKSAQFPLQVWLPDAMEGPTPVSALIHAATMVAAGIFLMARISILLTPTAGLIIAVIGVFTALISAISALFQYDIKKVLAYSTISQLGLMVTGIGIGATNAALFHLTTHAFFKAGLFLGAGAVIHYLHHNQDIRKMGNLRKRMPIIFWSFGICSAALAGLPFFSGYLSKDALLISAFSWADAQSSDVYFLIPLTAVFASALTAYYITRLYILVFFDRQGSTMKAIVKSFVNTYRSVKKGMQAVVSAEEMGFREKMLSNFIRSIGPMEAAVMVMAFGSLFIPFSLNPFSMENSSFGTTFPVDLSEKYHWVGYAMLFISLMSIWLSYIFSKEEVGRIRNGTAVYGESNWIARFAQNHFYINSLYRFIFVKPLTGISEKAEELDAQSETVNFSTVSGISRWLNYVDSVWVDGAVNRLGRLLISFADEIRNFEQVIVDKSITLISESAGSLGKLTQQLQAGRVQSYIISLIAGLILLIMLLFVLGN
jgi:NADH-quinone oxidoreductase subunit L